MFHAQLKDDEEEGEESRKVETCELASGDSVPPSETSGKETVTNQSFTESNVNPSEGEVKTSLPNGSDEEPCGVKVDTEQNSKLVATKSSELEALLVESALHNVMAPDSDQAEVVGGDKIEPHPLVDAGEGLGDLVLMQDLGLVVEKDCTELEAGSREGELAQAKEQEEASAEIKSEPLSFCSSTHL